MTENRERPNGRLLINEICSLKKLADKSEKLSVWVIALDGREVLLLLLLLSVVVGM